MSLMFPTIFALGLKGLGPNTKIGGSLLVMAIIGGAVLTPLMGLISEAHHGIAWAYTIPMLSYIYIVFYSFFGSGARRSSGESSFGGLEGGLRSSS
jgi:FHS family L-fucose permease-like MFS transporter